MTLYLERVSLGLPTLYKVSSSLAASGCKCQTREKKRWEHDGVTVVNATHTSGQRPRICQPDQLVLVLLGRLSSLDIKQQLEKQSRPMVDGRVHLH